MAKTKRRGPSLEDKYLGTAPSYHGQEFKSTEEVKSAYHKASNYLITQFKENLIGKQEI